MSEEDDDRSCSDATPSETAIRAGKGGIIPPVEHQFKTGNPGGGRPPNVGRSAIERCNDFNAMGLLEGDLREIAKDKNRLPVDRAAAVRLLRMMEMPDTADFEDVANGSKTLSQLRDDGVDTTVVKKIKHRTWSKDGESETTVEIELHDRSGQEFDRVCDRTDGKPKASLDVNHDGTLRTISDGATEAAAILSELGHAVVDPETDPGA